MAQEKTLQVKPRRKLEINKSHSKTEARSQSSIPAAKVKKLKALVQRHRDGDRVASWELGQMARKLLGHTDKKPATRSAIADLAEQIGLIKPPDPSSREKRRDAANLCQLVKFGGIATKRQAVALDKVGVPWRGVVYWIGVKDDNQRNQLYREMIAGLTNSTKIRNYIARHFKRTAPPRRHVDIARVGENAQLATRRLIDTLANLNDRLDEHADTDADAGRKKKKMPAARRRKLIASLDEAIKSARATRRKLV